ncbi:Hypothetical predicted protein [Xyrichtys novacula]|uniref:Uncharacterized protein n=1 Tax=Xyrichtys novacula TaxID=13765 RepID=A0AAV1H893_XYRNO|nr:Hypothetical predicted protein [Xyrichtys novacula]
MSERYTQIAADPRCLSVPELQNHPEEECEVIRRIEVDTEMLQSYQPKRSEKKFYSHSMVALKGSHQSRRGHSYLQEETVDRRAIESHHKAQQNTQVDQAPVVRRRVIDVRQETLLQSQIKMLRLELQKKDAEIARLPVLGDTSTRRLKEYRERVLHLIRDLQQAHDRERTLNQQVTSLQTSFNKTQDEAKQLQDESITNERNRSLLTEKVASLETRLDEKENENENLVAEIDDLKERNWSQEKHYREKVFHHTIALEQAQDNERTLNQQVTSLQTSFNKTQDEAKQLQDESITNERNRSLLTEKVASLETRLDEKENENENLVAEIDDLKERNWSQEKHYQEKVLHLTTALEQAQDNERTLNQQVTSLQTSFNKTQDEAKQLQDESITNERNRSLLTEKVASLETRLDEKENENENLVAEIDDLKERNWSQEKHCQEKVFHLTTALEQAQDNERTLNQQVTSLQTSFNKTQDEAKQLQDESITNERNRSLLTEKVASLETRLDEKENENENLVAEIDDLKERNWSQKKHYQEKVFHLTTALEQAQDKERALNQHSEETISKLREELKAALKDLQEHQELLNDRDEQLADKLDEQKSLAEGRAERIENMKSKIHNLQTELFGSDLELGEKNRTIRKLKREIANLQEITEDLHTHYTHSEETISKLREELKAKQEEEILASSERHLNSTGVQTDEISPDLEISPEPQQLETPAAEAQSESLWKRSCRGALRVGKFIGVSSACALVAVGMLSSGLIAHCDSNNPYGPCDPFSHLLELLTIDNTEHLF